MKKARTNDFGPTVPSKDPSKDECSQNSTVDPIAASSAKDSTGVSLEKQTSLAQESTRGAATLGAQAANLVAQIATPRGTPGPIRIDVSPEVLRSAEFPSGRFPPLNLQPIAFAQHPSTSLQRKTTAEASLGNQQVETLSADKLSSKTEIETEFQGPGVTPMDPQVLEFCSWLERSCLGGSFDQMVRTAIAPSAGVPPTGIPSSTEAGTSEARPPSDEGAATHPISIGRLWGRSPNAMSSDVPADAPFRRYDCQNYGVCLDVAAALDWENFTCSNCNGQVDQRLLWRARNALKKDAVAQRCCHLPEVSVSDSIDRTPENTAPDSAAKASPRNQDQERLNKR